MASISLRVAGGPLGQRFRREGQSVNTEAASGHQQWQDAADVSISSGGTGVARRQAVPDDDPSLYTHASDRSAALHQLHL